MALHPGTVDTGLSSDFAKSGLSVQQPADAAANWQDNGFHFYGRVRQRGPDAGINTPSDLESEIRKGTPKPEGTPNRWQINLPILSSGGQPLRVIYDYDGRKNSKCSLVTLSY